MDALKRANEVRLGRAEIKRDVQDGVIELDILLAEPPELLRGLPAFEILLWRRRIGITRARRLIRGLVSETLPLGALSEPTRVELVRRVGRIGRLQ